ncbi:CoA ester lyase [Streptomyces sp. NPDC046977]|uniref:HpcH/HpaI aldolase/citrate lyase family protein n=1 Tax=Streptomyces sp. NPDC046977 TaxID=3154703 RepID=UPI0033D387A1
MGTHTRRPLRVWIITPGQRADRFTAARASAAGVALADLEDSVAPADKPAARAAAEQLFDRPDPLMTLGLRVNATTTLDGARDLAAIADYTHKPDVLLVPKVESARDVEVVAGVLDTPDYAPGIWALIETPRAFDTLPSILSAPRLAGVIFGSADYAAAVGCGLGWAPLLHPRATLVNSAAAAGIPAIDAPFFDLDDLDGLRREAEQAKDLGFYGKGAVHPRQADIIRDVFTPSQREIDHARAVLAASEASGAGITSVGGQMVGRPFFAAARALVDEADATTGGA